MSVKQSSFSPQKTSRVTEDFFGQMVYALISESESYSTGELLCGDCKYETEYNKVPVSLQRYNL